MSRRGADVQPVEGESDSSIGLKDSSATMCALPAPLLMCKDPNRIASEASVAIADATASKRLPKAVFNWSLELRGGGQ